MRREKFVNGEIYHILNRGVDRRLIFLDDEDRFRFIHDLYEFNDRHSALNIYYRQTYNSYDFGNRKNEREAVVDILAFCVMPNHFHILIRQKEDDGIRNFMKKLGVGYANYFNNKNGRSGTLFEGRFKAVLIKSDSHLLHLPYYIHLNPLDLYEPSWREKRIKNLDMVMNFLEKYRWSSLLDYLGIKNFPSVTDRVFLTELIGSPNDLRESLNVWLGDFSLDNISEVALE